MNMIYMHAKWWTYGWDTAYPEIQPSPWGYDHACVKTDYFPSEKVHFTSLNYPRSLVFLSELENRVNHLPQLLKPLNLPP